MIAVQLLCLSLFVFYLFLRLEFFSMSCQLSVNQHSLIFFCFYLFSSAAQTDEDHERKGRRCGRHYRSVRRRCDADPRLHCHWRYFKYFRVFKFFRVVQLRGCCLFVDLNGKSYSVKLVMPIVWLNILFVDPHFFFRRSRT